MTDFAKVNYQKHLFGRKLSGVDESYLVKVGYDENVLTSEDKYNVYQEKLKQLDVLLKQFEKNQQSIINNWNKWYERATPSCDSH